jgi:hypothetical protein
LKTQLSLAGMKTLMILPLTMLFVCITIVGKAQNCTITCPENIVAKADSGKGGTYVQFPAAVTSGNCGQLSYTPASGSFFKIGSTSVIVTSASGQRCSFTVTVTDNEPPSLSPIFLSSKRLWPANGKMRDVSVGYVSSDNSNELNCLVTVASNGSDSASGNWQVVDNHSIRLRASRLPNGMARIYTVTVTCTDAAGNTTRRTTGISVAKNVAINSQ